MAPPPGIGPLGAKLTAHHCGVRQKLHEEAQGDKAVTMDVQPGPGDLGGIKDRLAILRFWGPTFAHHASSRASKEPWHRYATLFILPMRSYSHRVVLAALTLTNSINPLLPFFKDVNTTRGLNYHYYFSPPELNKPTLLLVHGFPSFAVDWHPQINYFKEKGYGIVAPDQLGYGGTAKPAESAAYVHSLLAKDMVDILDHENVTDVIAVGHDWGSKTVSVLANLYTDRFLAFGFLACGYIQPLGIGTTIEELREAAIALLGYENFGYWEFFNAPDATHVIQDHLKGFFDILYAKDGRLNKFNMGPEGAIRVFIESNTSTPRIPAITKDQWRFHKEQFRRDTLNGPLNYYRINLNGETRQDDEQIPEENYTIRKPVFFGGAHNDYVCVDWAQEAGARQYAADLTVVNFNTTHWVAADAPRAVNEALEKWINEAVLV
ncbi:hypothetical protein NMY22_g17904 [Coprinellus aureogranulatus]|nr:hypothetical protein NMY22_g17904 [Coprinellus aureogranulatus]